MRRTKPCSCWGPYRESPVPDCQQCGGTGTVAEEENLVGKVGVCSRGRPGLITGRKELAWGLSWVGIGLDDGSAWSSRAPRVVARDELDALAESKMAARSRESHADGPYPPSPRAASGPEVWVDEEDEDLRV